MARLRDVGIEPGRNFWTSMERVPETLLFVGCIAGVLGYSAGRSNPERAAQQGR